MAPPTSVKVDVVEDRTVRALQRAAPGLSESEIERIRSETRILVDYVEPTDAAAKKDRLVTTATLLNLLARTFRNVHVRGIPPAQLFPQSPKFAARIQDGAFLKEAPSLVIVLSDEPATHPNGRVLHVDSRGWTAYLSTTGPCTLPRGPHNPIGAFYAAARAACDAFNYAFREKLTRAKFVSGVFQHDLITLATGADPSHEPRIDEGPVVLDDVMIVGVGAVGMAVIHALCQLPDMRGRLRLLDAEATDETNEGRYLLSFPENRGQFKALLAWNLLKDRFPLLDTMPSVPIPIIADTQVGVPGGGVSAVTRVSTFPVVDYALFQRASGEGRPTKLVIATVDSAAVRRDIQFGLHKTVINAWTNTGRSQLDYGVGRHTIAGPHVCCACVYHEPLTVVPTELEFALGLTGWDVAKVKRRLREDSHVRLTPEEGEQLRHRLGFDVREMGNYVGKTLLELVEQTCGVGGRSFDGRGGNAPVPHLAVLAAAHVVTEIILESLGRPPAVKNLCSYDALILPPSEAPCVENKRHGCMCGDADVENVYAETWGDS